MIDLLIEHKYIAFFIGMLIGGDIILITGIYLATRNHFDIRALVAISYVANILSDLVWYQIGKRITKSKLSHMPILEKKRDLIDHVSRFVSKHGFKALFYSKFIYGTRTLVQVIAGIHHLSFGKYVGVNSIGSLLYIFLLIFLGYVLHFSVESIQSVVKNGAIVLAIFVAAVMIINIWISKKTKHLFQ